MKNPFLIRRLKIAIPTVRTGSPAAAASRRQVAANPIPGGRCGGCRIHAPFGKEMKLRRNRSPLQGQEPAERILRTDLVILRLNQKGGRSPGTDAELRLRGEIVTAQIGRINQQSIIGAERHPVRFVNRLIRHRFRRSGDGRRQVGSRRKAEATQPVRPDAERFRMEADEPHRPRGVGARGFPQVRAAVLQQESGESDRIEPAADIASLVIPRQKLIAAAGADHHRRMRSTAADRKKGQRRARDIRQPVNPVDRFQETLRSGSLLRSAERNGLVPQGILRIIHICAGSPAGDGPVWAGIIVLHQKILHFKP